MSEGPIRIAIVEDQDTTRETFEAIINLEPSMECILTCSSGEEALRKLPKVKPDVVLMDIMMPHMTGIECATRLKEVEPEIEIVMITVYQDPDLIFGALRAGACGYLLKRSSPDQVKAAIRDAYRGGVPMSVGIARKVISYFRQEAQVASDVDSLSAREREVLEHVAKGFTNKEIAAKLCVTSETVHWHLRNCYRKLHVRTRTEAAMKLRQGVPGGGE
ncbi:response regulator transcription factor [Pelagicoccus sp. SDUM812003]|uniref:response regulator transcription factor n=1 Tax=Pelagicoccus sp. SDUM812003 TaxID=3041267 RepID=UPI00280CCB0A|nr:response regulator transcription factor [Pelagicoccus sp. SDUM812003]MDQ8204149.1 response regulator transcription factor [Pelagicoccus sp. SDUM812003]